MLLYNSACSTRRGSINQPRRGGIYTPVFGVRNHGISINKLVFGVRIVRVENNVIRDDIILYVCGCYKIY